MAKHKWAKEIKAWISGADVEMCCFDAGKWVKLGDGEELSIFDNKYIKFREKNTITINGIEVPQPLREPPCDGTRYYVALFDEDGGITSYNWAECSFDTNALKEGFVHLSEEDAIAHAKAIIAANGGIYGGD